MFTSFQERPSYF